jgi:hypothetical protein
MSTLSPLNIPVCFQVYSGPETTYYITFFRYNKQGSQYAENEEIATGHYIQVDVWSKTDYTDIVEQVESLMVAAGFSTNGSKSLYETDTRIFHESMDFLYNETLDD